MTTLKIFSLVGGTPTAKIVIEGVPEERLTPVQAYEVFKAVKEKYKLKSAKSYIMLNYEQVFVLVREKTNKLKEKPVFRVYELSGEI
jgi:hypothetical protein